jgi:hypothetical protein
MAKVYVGTYKKYNNGSIAGGWLDLADYATYRDFLAACQRLHKDERDPEFMIQDTSDFPDGLDCLEWLSEQDFNDVKAAMQEEGQEEQPEASTAPAVNIVDYSDKAFAVIGDTKAVKDQLKQLGGRFNGRLSCGAGWIFSAKMRDAVEQFIAAGVVNAVRSKRPAPSEDDKALLTEYIAEMAKVWGEDKSMLDYYRKNFSGAVRLSNGGILVFDKPSIENKFCFADEGPDYDLYRSLSDEKKMADYFKRQNLADIEREIERLEGRNKDGQVLTLFQAKYDSCDKPLNVYGWRWLREWDLQERDPCVINYNEERMSEADRKTILAGLKAERTKFEKRLDTYLKRYGVSKLHTWTYWRDA